MLQQLYYIKQHVGAKYLSLAAKWNFKTIHQSIEKNYSCDHSVLHGVISVYSYIAHLYTFRIQNN